VRAARNRYWACGHSRIGRSSLCVVLGRACVTAWVRLASSGPTAGWDRRLAVGLGGIDWRLAVSGRIDWRLAPARGGRGQV
jgi:hypothetical protein